jgi:hypothetical protein
MINRIKYFILIYCFILMGFNFPDPICKSVKNGVFHFYQNDGQYHGVVIRKDSLQIEVNQNTLDTTFWRILWLSDCQFTCSFISGTKMKWKEELTFYKMSKLTFSIQKVTKQYYTFDASFTSSNNSRTFSDTMWLEAK